jgi:hypothetical protein
VKRQLLALAAGLAMVATGCGGSSDKDKIRSTVQTYVDGLAEKDGRKVCDQLTLAVQAQVKQRSQAKDCATAIDRFEASATGKAVAPAFKTAKIKSVTAKGSTAAVTVTVKVGGSGTDTTIPLQKVNGKWKISSPAQG